MIPVHWHIPRYIHVVLGFAFACLTRENLTARMPACCVALVWDVLGWCCALSLCAIRFSMEKSSVRRISFSPDSLDPSFHQTCLPMPVEPFMIETNREKKERKKERIPTHRVCRLGQSTLRLQAID